MLWRNVRPRLTGFIEPCLPSPADRAARANNAVNCTGGQGPSAATLSASRLPTWGV
jgi:hypothetical protein